jgi:hypothetical protein
MELEGGREEFYSKEEPIETVSNELVNELTNVKQAIYDKVVLGKPTNDSKEAQDTKKAIYYEYIMRRLCLDLEPSQRISNMIPFDELPKTNSIIASLKKDSVIGPMIESLVKLYRELSKTENAKYNSDYIKVALLQFPWPYSVEND